MQNVVPVVPAVSAGLLVVQAALILVRVPSCVRADIPAALAGALLLAALRPFLPQGSVAEELDLIGLLWLAGTFLLIVGRRRGAGAWAGASAAAMMTMLLARALGHGLSVEYRILRALSFAALDAFLLGQVLAVWRSRACMAALVTFAVGCLWTASGAISVAASFGLRGPGIPDGLSELLFSLCTGWVVLQEGFPLRPAWKGSLPALHRQQGMDGSLFDRLHSAEQSAAARERTMSAGFLALGAAHELKNALTLVKLAAHHGLATPEPSVKDECLRQIIERTAAARDSALDVLDRLAADGGEAPRTLNARRDLTGALRRAAALLRGQGIVIQLDLDPVCFRARRFDVEQIILNLVRNAAESYDGQPAADGQAIVVSAKPDEELVVIDVRDRAGGVEEALRPFLFAPSTSRTGSTGLGLYLSRNLALRNGGTLDYVPADGGSVFRLTLPLAEEAPS